MADPTEESTLNISGALLKAQGDMPGLQKNSINPHFGNKYISLDSLMTQVLPILNKHGLVLVQAPSIAGTEPALTTTIIHATSQENIQSQMLLVLDKDSPQGQGSAITYARRYALMALLGLVADEDDDANAATGAKPAPRKPRPRKTGETPVTVL